MYECNEKIIKNKIGLLNLAEELRNVSTACKVMGFSRDTFYRYKSAVEEGGVEALFDKSRRQPNIKTSGVRCIWLRHAFNNIEHTKTKARHPQTNGICERFHKIILNEFYQVTFRKKVYTILDELQKNLDDWLFYYNHQRTHQGKMCCGRTPIETLLDGKSIWKEKVENLNLN